MSNDPDSKGWWQTLPGLLTAGAAVITAVSGLLLALHQTGIFDRNSHAPAQIQMDTASMGGSSSPGGSQSAAAPQGAQGSGARKLSLPGTTRVNFQEAAYELLEARVEPYSSDTVALHLNVRMTNNGRYPANFWVASFRLLVDGALQAPTNDLDDVVPAQSAKEGEVEFVIPSSASTVGLEMGEVGEGKPSIPINLRSTRQ